MTKEQQKEILILGCGYLGVKLAQAAVKRGFRVKAVSRNAESLAAVSKLGAETFRGMVDENQWHEFAGKSVSLVVNCVSSAGGGMIGYEQSYVGGNRSLVAWSKSIGFVGTAIYTSSVGVYPDAGGDIIDELNHTKPSTERGRVMLESESVFLKGMVLCRAFVLRLAGLYGPQRHLMLDTIKEAPEALPGWGDYFLNLVRIEDVVSSVWSCLESTHDGGVFNVVDDESCRKQDIVAWLAKRLDVAVPRFSGAAAVAGVSSRRFEGGKAPANRRVSNSRIKDELGWRPRFRNFREGFEDLLK